LQASTLLKMHMYKHKVIKDAQLIKAWIKLKLFTVLGPYEITTTSTDFLQVLIFSQCKTYYDTTNPTKKD